MPDNASLTHDRTIAAILRPSYTWADLLAFAQTLSPAQLTQQVWGWDEGHIYDQIKPFAITEDWLNVDGEGYVALSEQSTDCTAEELNEAPRLPAGTVILQVQE